MTLPVVRFGTFCKNDLPEMLEGLALHLRTGTPLKLNLAIRSLVRRTLGLRRQIASAPQFEIVTTDSAATHLESSSKFCISWRALAETQETIRLFLDTEPDLARLSRQPLECLPVMPHLNTPRHRAWVRLITGLTRRYRRIIFVPWLVHGGADRVALHALKAAHEVDGPESTLLLLTDHSRKDAADWLPPGTELRSLSELGETLDPDDRFSIVVTLIHSLQPEAVLNVNSEATWRAFAQHGRALSGVTRLYAGVFCPDYDDAMRRGDYAFRYLRQCLPHLSGVYLDNAAFAAELSEDFGLPKNEREKLRVVYQPVPGHLPAPLAAARTLLQKAPGRFGGSFPPWGRQWIGRRNQHQRHPLSGQDEKSFASLPPVPAQTRPRLEAPSPVAPRVLWASRVAMQKNPAILLDIAKLAGWCRFEAFGHGARDTVEDLQCRAPHNLQFRGSYDSFHELGPNEFNVFLYTTLWDGIPNVLLEAGAAGLPIVAPRVGGIPELINDDTGWLVNDPRDAKAYAGALAQAINSPDETKRRTENLCRLIARRHAWKSYAATFAGEAGFLLAEHEIRKLDRAYA